MTNNQKTRLQEICSQIEDIKSELEGLVDEVDDEDEEETLENASEALDEAISALDELVEPDSIRITVTDRNAADILKALQAIVQNNPDTGYINEKEDEEKA